MNTQQRLLPINTDFTFSRLIPSLEIAAQSLPIGTLNKEFWISHDYKEAEVSEIIRGYKLLDIIDQHNETLTNKGRSLLEAKNEREQYAALSEILVEAYRPLFEYLEGADPLEISRDKLMSAISEAYKPIGRTSTDKATSFILQAFKYLKMLEYQIEQGSANKKSDKSNENPEKQTTSAEIVLNLRQKGKEPLSISLSLSGVNKSFGEIIDYIYGLKGDEMT